MSNKESIHKRLANELALEQYSYDLLRDKVNQQVYGRNKQRKEEIEKQMIEANNEYIKALNNSSDKVLRQIEDKRNLAQLQRKSKAQIDLRDQKIKLQGEKGVYYKLIENDRRVSQIINDLRNHSQNEYLKQELLLKNLQQKRQTLLVMIDDSKIKEQNIMQTIDILQSQL